MMPPPWVNTHTITFLTSVGLNPDTIVRGSLTTDGYEMFGNHPHLGEVFPPSGPDGHITAIRWASPQTANAAVEAANNDYIQALNQQTMAEATAQLDTPARTPALAEEASMHDQTPAQSPQNRQR